eukprot:TRINITY_DN12342_c0_g1_i4.p1 TRINITY_DN12342_c0_g1~~TRINITY_DN12342_c0_g1_i4.p1  ORF type:complete len:380 (-),score=67.72 TRINITY_DN12342_c0_g1_i4:159-1298(-)
MTRPQTTLTPPQPLTLPAPQAAATPMLPAPWQAHPVHAPCPGVPLAATVGTSRTKVNAPGGSMLAAGGSPACGWDKTRQMAASAVPDREASTPHPYLMQSNQQQQPRAAAAEAVRTASACLAITQPRPVMASIELPAAELAAGRHRPVSYARAAGTVRARRGYADNIVSVQQVACNVTPAASSTARPPSSAAPEAGLQARAADVRSALGGTPELLQELLLDRQLLKRAVVQCCKRVANSAGRLEATSLEVLKGLLASVLQVPGQVLGELGPLADCFDFEGRGCLRVAEVHKLVRFGFYQFLEQSGWKDPPLSLPTRAPSSSGYVVQQEIAGMNYWGGGLVKLAAGRDGKRVALKCIPKAGSGTAPFLLIVFYLPSRTVC